jgi:outer membrane immunogenic protein
MYKETTLGLAAAAALMVPGVAAAQEATVADAFVVASLGYHDLGVSGEIDDDLGFDIDDASIIYGAAAGFDVPVGGNAFIGLEGNIHFGSDVIDYEFGGNARLGFKTESGSKFYLRAGYQHVNLDPAQLIDEDITFPPGTFDDVEDSQGDYLVGVGADLPLGGIMVRGTVDTISFDSLRATVGVGVAF